MIDYDKIINLLSDELDSCNYKYVSGTSTLVPAYYKQEIEEAIGLLIKCRDSIKGLQTQTKSTEHDPYKVKQLLIMLKHETSDTEEHYGANLAHWAGDSKPLQIDAGGIRALISHYSTHRTDLENGEE